ncbi:MAG: fibronectin type III domain-containing protein [Bacteroidales bacterium]|nr:fibronectin type III domain-containing protein [Bacteroidales bacterium]
MKKQFFLVWVALFLNAYSQNVGISNSVIVPDPSAILELRSTTGGLLIPRMTTAQRNAITSPAHALLIYNTTSNCYEWWNANLSQWLSFACECTVPQQPNALPATNITSNSFHAQWSAVPGATGYYIDVAYNSTFTNFVSGYNNYNAGNNTWILLSGLPCNRNYYYRVRAYNSCGTSANSGTITVYVPCKGSCYTLGRSGDDVGTAMINTLDGGYLLMGRTNSSGFGSNDNLMMKLDHNFNISWSKVIGGTASDEGLSMIATQLSDQNFFGAGHTYSFGAGGLDFFIYKFTPTGQRLWSYTIGASSNDFTYGASAVLDDGSVVWGGSMAAVGPGLQDAVIFRMDNNGNISTSLYFGGTHNEGCEAICKTSDGGYIIAGNTWSFGAGNQDGYVAKFSSANTLQWAKAYGGPGNERFWSMKPTNDLGYILCGYTDSYGVGSFDVWVLKIDGSGNLQWARTIGGPSSEEGYHVIPTNDGGYLVVGYTNSFGAGGQDAYVVKLSSTGALNWTKTIGGTGNEWFQTVILNNSTGEYIALGTTNSFGSGGNDILLVRLDPNGNICTDCESGSGGNLTTSAPTVNNFTPTTGTPAYTRQANGNDATFFSDFRIRCNY